MKHILPGIIYVLGSVDIFNARRRQPLLASLTRVESLELYNTIIAHTAIYFDVRSTLIIHSPICVAHTTRLYPRLYC